MNDNELFYSFAGSDLNPVKQFYFVCPTNQKRIWVKWMWVFMFNSLGQGMRCIATLTDSTNTTPIGAIADDGGTLTLGLDNGLFAAASDTVPFVGRVPISQGNLYQIVVSGNFISPPGIGGDFTSYIQMVLEFE